MAQAPWRVQILTLFPEMFPGPLATSIVGTAQQRELWSLEAIDIRDFGLMGAIELESIPGAPTKRAFSAFVEAFEKGLLIRTTGDIIALSPPLIITKSEIDQLFLTLTDILKNLD